MNDSKRKEELVVQLRQLADKIETKKDLEFDDCTSSLRDIIYKSSNVPIPSLDTLETALDEIYDSKLAHSDYDPNSNSNSNCINSLPESEYVSTKIKQIQDRFSSKEREEVMSTAFTQGNLNQIVFRSDFHRRIKQLLTKRFYLFDNMDDDDFSIDDIINCPTTKMNRLLLNDFLNTDEDSFKQTVVTLYDDIIALSKSKKEKKKERGGGGEEEKTGIIEERERKDDSEDENELDSSLLWLTQEDFVEYVCDDSNFSKSISTKQELQLNGLFVILFEIGVFWKLVDKMVNEKIAWSEEMVVKSIECGLIDVSFVNNNNQSLYHIATACNDTSMFDKLYN